MRRDGRDKEAREAVSEYRTDLETVFGTEAGQRVLMRWFKKYAIFGDPGSSFMNGKRMLLLEEIYWRIPMLAARAASAMANEAEIEIIQSLRKE